MVECHVVVQEAEEPVVTLDEAQHLVGRRAVPGGVPDRPHECVLYPLANPLRHVTRLADDQEQALQVGVVLLGQAVEHLVEPVPRIAHHHHCHDGRGELVGGFHEAARLLRTGHGAQALSDKCLQ